MLVDFDIKTHILCVCNAATKKLIKKKETPQNLMVYSAAQATLQACLFFNTTWTNLKGSPRTGQSNLIGTELTNHMVPLLTVHRDMLCIVYIFILF